MHRAVPIHQTITRTLYVEMTSHILYIEGCGQYEKDMGTQKVGVFLRPTIVK